MSQKQSPGVSARADNVASGDVNPVDIPRVQEAIRQLERLHAEIKQNGVTPEIIRKTTDLLQSDPTGERAAARAAVEAEWRMRYSPYTMGKINYDSLDGVTEEELKAAGIESMKKSEWLGDVQTFFVDRSERFKLTLYARSRTLSEEEAKALREKLASAEKICTGPAPCPVSDTPFILGKGNYFSGCKYLRVGPGLVEYVEIDGVYAMHDIKVFHSS